MLARPAPQVDVSTLQAEVDSHRAENDMILEARVSDSEAPSAEPAEDTVMAALFATSEIPPPPLREHDKRFRGREEDEARHEIRSAMIWRLRGEPRLLMKRHVR